MFAVISSVSTVSEKVPRRRVGAPTGRADHVPEATVRQPSESRQSDPQDRQPNELGRQAAEIARREGEGLVAGDDPILKALMRITEDPDLRGIYRQDLKRRLKEQSRQQLIAGIGKDFDRERLGRYREVIREQGFRRGALPWPLCIPFKCCEE